MSSIFINPYPLRVDYVTMQKFKVVAAENNRSVNKELTHLMKESIREYEALNGEIEISPQEDYEY